MALGMERTEAVGREDCHHGWRGASAERISTPCPACGAHSLFVGSGGHLTCSVIGCPAPSTADVIDGLKADVARLTREVAQRDRMLETWRFAFPDGSAGRLMERATECEAKP